MGKLLEDEKWRHVNYRHTDVRRTWERERKRLKAVAEAEQRAAESAMIKVAARKIGGKS